MKFRNRHLGVWIMLFCFFGQITFAEVIPNDSGSRAGNIKVNSEIVPNDSGSRAGNIKVNSEVVPNDSGSRAGNIKVNNEVVPNDSGSRTPQQHPITINPFVGEIAVGVTLLLTYGPQILALAAAVASIAAGVGVLMKTNRQAAGLMQVVGGKMQKMLSLLLGPLTVNNGMAKEGVEGISSQLLKVTKFVTNSISTPAGEVKNSVEETLAMTKDLEKTALNGKNLSETMKKMASDESKSLKTGVVAGGEVQSFRDGVMGISNRLAKQADISAAAFNQTLINTRMSTKSLNSLQARLEKAIAGAGKPVDEVTLADINLSGAEISKQLIEARKYMVMSKNTLSDADKSTFGLHTELMKILGDIKGDLEKFAADQGVDVKQLEALGKAKQKQSHAGQGMSQSIQSDSDFGKPAPRLTEEIKFMVDDLARMNNRARLQIQKYEEKTRASAPLPDGSQKSSSADGVDKENLFNKKLSAYKNLVQLMTREPGNRTAIQEAKAAFELIDRECQEAAGK